MGLVAHGLYAVNTFQETEINAISVFRGIICNLYYLYLCKTVESDIFDWLI